MLIVEKYGGTSLERDRDLRMAARNVAEEVHRGNRVVAVVSARGNLTDRLIRQAQRVSRALPLRELDACLTAGEQISAALFSMALEAEGCSAVSLTGWQTEIRTNGVFGDGQILSVGTERILRELEAGKTVVVAGFQGIDNEGNMVTLGRGGSDTSAVALASALGADCCRICTDVDGIFDKDPGKYPGAVQFSVISYEKMLGLISGGAQVLHRRSVETARDGGIRLEVRSAFSGRPGTMVGDFP